MELHLTIILIIDSSVAYFLVSKNSLKKMPKMMSLDVLFFFQPTVQKPKEIQFTMIQITEKLQILIFKKLEAAQFGIFS